MHPWFNVQAYLIYCANLLLIAQNQCKHLASAIMTLHRIETPWVNKAAASITHNGLLDEDRLYMTGIKATNTPMILPIATMRLDRVGDNHIVCGSLNILLFILDCDSMRGHVTRLLKVASTPDSTSTLCPTFAPATIAPAVNSNVTPTLTLILILILTLTRTKTQSSPSL